MLVGYEVKLIVNNLLTISSCVAAILFLFLLV